MVVERGISLGDALQFVVEVDYDLAKREVVEEFDTVSRDVILLNKHATLTQTEGHDRPDESGLGDDRGADEGFVDVIDKRRVGEAPGVVHFGAYAFAIVHLVRYVRHRGDHIHSELAFETFLYDLHV